MIDLIETIVVVGMICATAIHIARLKYALRDTEELVAIEPRKVAPEIPSDLVLAASKWHDAWAKEQALQRIQELYDTTQDWDKVRYIFSQQDYAE